MPHSPLGSKQIEVDNIDIVADEFLSSGMGDKFNQLYYYNSMKYPKNSPRGQEVTQLSGNPNILQSAG